MKRSALVAAALISICASTTGAAQVPGVPPYQGVYEPQGVDERGQWMMADERERRLRDSNLLIRDEALNDYVKGVLCRAVGDDRCRNVRIYILRVPLPNALMSANGTLVLWSGFLLRMKNEAELAAILGHEFAHFERRHTLNGFRRQRSTNDVIQWLALLGAMTRTPVYVDLLVGDLYRFTRDQERESDLLSLGYLYRSRYRPMAAAEMFDRLMDEADASSLGRGQRIHRYDSLAFLDDHPTTLERATYLRALAEPELPDRIDGEEAYAAALRPWMAGFLEDQVKLNDFGGSEYLLTQLAHGHWTAELLYWRGELYRMRGNPRDLVNAADFYRQSIQLDANRAEAFRGLGLALMRAQAPEEGRQALARYLALKPDASDAPMIRMLAGQGS